MHTVILVGLIVAITLWYTTESELDLWDETSQRLFAFTTLLNKYGVDHGTIPGPTLNDALDVLKKDQSTMSLWHGQYLPESYHTHDAWRRAFVYQWSEQGSLVIVRSLGGNGLDENGKGDDIQDTIDIRWLKEEPATQSAPTLSSPKTAATRP